MAADQGLPRSRGINNIVDPLNMGLGWRMALDNMEVDEAGRECTRSGYTTIISQAISSSYSTIDPNSDRLYISDGKGLLRVYVQDGSTQLLAALATGGGDCFWAEINREVYFNDGLNAFIIREDDSIIPIKNPFPETPQPRAGSGSLDAGLYRICFSFLHDDGRETGCGDFAEIILADGSSIELDSTPFFPGFSTLVYICPANSTVFQLAGQTRGEPFRWNSPANALLDEQAASQVDCLPDGAGPICFHGGRLICGYYEADKNQSHLFKSEALGFHLFDLESSRITIKGKINALGSHNGKLIAVSDIEIHAFDDDSATKLANFGGPASPFMTIHDAFGLVIDTHRGPYFYNANGFSAVAPQLYPEPGKVATSCIIERDGAQKLLIFSKGGGRPFNSQADLTL